MGTASITVPPPVKTGERGGDSRWVQLTKARHDIDAHLLTGRLSESGIETKTVPDRTAPGAWLYGGSNPWAPVSIYVRNWQLEDARVALAEISFHAPSARRPSPSKRVIRRWQTPVVWWTTAIVLALLFTAIGLRQLSYFVARCDVPVVCPEREGDR